MEQLLDPVFLSRIQFAFVVSFHAVFPVFSIGMASFIALLQAFHYSTQNPVYERLALFWTKIFALAFGMGVVSGIVMSFQFGTNWSAFSYATANFLGPMLGYEVVTAFFLEAAFLGVLLFGRDKVTPGTHLFAACMVALGTFISSFWILSANSWLHTPAGVEVINGMYVIRDWSEAIFNPSFPYRFSHMVLASFLTGAFVVAGVSSWFLLQKRDTDAHRTALNLCMWLILILAPAQVLMGDLHGLNTLEHQPTKVAAMEGNWHTDSHVPLLLFAIPDQEEQKNHLEVGIPNLASIILKHDPAGVVPGITESKPEHQPWVFGVFWSFRVMVGIGMLMVLTAVVGLYLRWKRKLYDTEWFHRALIWMIPAPFVAVLAGWFVTEIGRSPWLVYGMMTHTEGITQSVSTAMVLTTLIGYVTIYAVVYTFGMKYIFETVKKGIQ